MHGLNAIDATSLICEGRSCCKFYAAEYQNARDFQCLRLLMPKYAVFSNALESSVLQGVHENDTQQGNILHLIQRVKSYVPMLLHETEDVQHSPRRVSSKETLVQSFSRWVVICDCDLGDRSLTSSDFRW